MIKKNITPINYYKNLQIGDNDLVGNKFNGHDLHLYLINRGVDSSHLVINKESDDETTYIIAGDKTYRDKIIEYSSFAHDYYDVDAVNNFMMYDVMYNKLFIDSDVVHFHLMHNGIVDLNLLPIMSKLKPIVWTLHDTWSVFPDDNSRGKDYVFPSDIKNLSLNYAIKKNAIVNSDVTFITASKYIKDIVEKSPIYKGKKIFHVPFGLNLDIFYPRGREKTRKQLGFRKTEKIVVCRGNFRNTKGLDYIEYVMNSIGPKYDIRLLVLGENHLENLPPNLRVVNYGWINDDDLIARIYSASDLLLMPSKRDAFGMMAIEAMACGTVPIVTEGTALPETVNAPGCGFSTPRDKDEFCNAVEYFLNNPKERLAREMKCVDYVKKKHSIDKYVDGIEAVYRYAMAGHKLDESGRNIMSDIKKYNQISPRLELDTGPSKIKIHQRLIDAAIKTKESLLSKGIIWTVGRITHKLSNKFVNILRINYLRHKLGVKKNLLVQKINNIMNRHSK